MSVSISDLHIPRTTLKFNQSDQEQHRLISLSTLNSHGNKPKLATTYVFVPHPEMPFPKYSFETTEVTCVGGGCTYETALHKSKLGKKTPFGL